MDESLLLTVEDAIHNGDVETLRSLFHEHPELVRTQYGANTWLHTAAHVRNAEVGQLLINMGCDVNAPQRREKITSLHIAIGNDDLVFVQLLLKHGARVDVEERLLISAIVGQNQNSLELVKLLVEHGADIHTVYMNELTKKSIPMNALSTAMDWGKQDVVEYLLSLGATLPEGLPQQAEEKPWHQRISSLFGGAADLSEEIVQHFNQHFGPVQPNSLIEIVPTTPSIKVHVVPADGTRNHLTLFTTGASTYPMRVPAGNEHFRFAELFIQLPGNWPLTLDDPANYWPMLWLRSMGKYPYQYKTWLGGPVAIVTNGDPPEPLAPGLQFTAMLLLNEGRIEASQGRLVQLYRLMPIYPEEQALEKREGIPDLLQAFDRCHTPLVVDIHRQNVAIT